MKRRSLAIALFIVAAIAGLALFKTLSQQPLPSLAGVKIPPALKGDFITALHFEPDLGLFITGFESGRVSLLDVRSGQLRILQGHEGRVLNLAVSPDQQKLATSADETLIWDLTSGESLRRIPQADGQTAWWSNDKTIFLTMRGVVRIYDVETGTFHAAEPRCNSSTISIALSPDNQWLATGSASGSVCLWRVLADGQYRALDLAARFTTEGSRNWIKRLAFSSNGSQLLSVSARDGVQLWSVPDLSLIKEGKPVLSPVRDAHIIDVDTGTVALTGVHPDWKGKEDHFVAWFSLDSGISEILKAKTSTLTQMAWLSQNRELVVGNVTKYVVLDVPADQ